MNTNSNTYTVIYASVMVVIVAFVLAFVSQSLKPTQAANVLRDTKKQILSSVGLADAEDIDAKFKEVVTDNTMEADGSLKSVPADKFESNYKVAINKKQYHVFVVKNGDKTQYVIPVYGRGLWDDIWGYVAINAAKTNVEGVYFGHKGETPGLGARITEAGFQSRFLGKQLRDGSTITLSVAKGKHAVSETTPVDGISGATVTSVSVSRMIQECFANYIPFLTK